MLYSSSPPLLGHHHLRSDDAHVSFSESTQDTFLLSACLCCRMIFSFSRAATSSRFIVLCLYLSFLSTLSVLICVKALQANLQHPINRLEMIFLSNRQSANFPHFAWCLFVCCMWYSINVSMDPKTAGSGMSCRLDSVSLSRHGFCLQAILTCSFFYLNHSHPPGYGSPGNRKRQFSLWAIWASDGIWL